MLLLAHLQTVCLVAFALLLLAAAWQDVRTMRIPNRLSIAIVGVFVIWAAAGVILGRLPAMDLAFAVVFGAIVFIVGALAFAAGAFGGGDVKLLAASSLFAGPTLLPDLLLVMAVVGGVMGCAIVSGIQIGPAPAPGGAIPVTSRLRASLPYGPAIAAGGLWIIFVLI
jgi:prepilin peptidase CpaA